MYAVERLSSYITRGVYTVSGPFHPFGGAVDIIVVQQQDGSFKSSPWNVRFGKFQGVLKTKEKIVNICVNGADARFHMYLDHKGEAYFLRDAGQDEGDSLVSPPSSGDETEGQMKNGRLSKAQSCDYGDGCGEPIGGQLDVGNGKMVVTTASSRRPRIFGLVFGRRTVKEGAANARDVQRVSSLERAEIAADLLEVKWSTNLSTDDDQKGANFFRVPSDGAGVGNTIDREKMLPVQSLDSGYGRDDEIASHREEKNDKLESDVVTAKHIDEPVCNDYPELRTFEEVIEIYSSEAGELAHANEDLSSLPKAVEFDVSFKESIVVNPALDLYSHAFHELSSDQDSLSADVSREDSGHGEVSSFLFCETSESSNVMHDVSAKTAVEVLNSMSEGERGDLNAECMKDIYQPSEENHRFEPRQSTVKDKFDICRDENMELNSKIDVMQTDHDAIVGGCEKLVATVVRSFSMGSPLRDLSFQNLQSIKSEAVDVKQQGPFEKETNENVTDIDMPEISRYLYDMDGSSEKLSFHMTGFNVDEQPSPTEEGNPQSSHVSIETLNTSVRIHEPHNPIESVKSDKCDIPMEDNIIQEFSSSLHMSEMENGAFLLPDNEEEQFLFDEDSFGPNYSLAQLVNTSETEAENCPSIVLKDGLRDSECVEKSQHMHHADIFPTSKGQTSPISIPKLKGTSEAKEQWVGSLPDIRSHIHDLERSDVHSMSHSLHITSNSSMGGARGKDISIIKSKSESNLLLPHTMSQNEPVTHGMQRMGETDGMPISPIVEISLCRHLLFEGMGAEAASEAFDAEKVELQKFATLGPSVVKNDKLVIRIRGRYFPWNAAAPIILGIASFGHEGILDAEGMIAVDRTDKVPREDPSRAIVSSRGAWRLWPFNFKKQRSASPAHLAPNANETTENDTEVASVDNKMLRDDTVQKSRPIKKKVRSVTPTSEQLASLDLKDGQNFVTFSFSTAMLGRQQVDARIYLWKWNTRIVVSDVDGTITKSDVLGQFMPLVGKDWSQTGVAHLFSAIKENGYQLLFLSARAISQAYLTRQFLFNLKQDGKALPDGPVVISPDGLFPSLYREVIRRAPHEFKISCLEEIRALFPPECNPFYAGFGNRDTDEISYLKVGIPKGKIFIINPKGEVVVNRRIDTKSYTSLHSLVNAMFPAMPAAEQEDFNSWNYWKLPLPDIDI